MRGTVRARSARCGVPKSGERLRFPFLIAAVIACLVVSGSAAQSSPQRRFRRQPVQKDPPAAQPVAPAVPLSPEQMPASPPQVAFNSGILTIIANNSTLGDILRAVHRQTGATVDVPGNATERVVGKFGPGPVRDVLTLLLNGSHFNYVLLGSATNPNALDRVMLISRSGGMEEPAQQANAAAQYQAPPVAASQFAENPDAANDDAADTMQDTNDAVEDQANQAQPEEQPQRQPNPFGQPGAVKTPEQLLQELQQRQQQMQQQQQQQPGAQQSFPPTPLGVPQPEPAPPQ
jgi:hypothetical protein